MSVSAPRMAYVFLDDVLPRGDQEVWRPSIRKRSARQRSIRIFPEGGTMLGFGVKFFLARVPRWPARNERSFPVVLQYVDDKSYVVWPNSQKQREEPCCLCRRGTTFSDQQ